MYQAGLVPYADTVAQDRCFTYLADSISKLETEISSQGKLNSHQTSSTGAPPDNLVGLLKNQLLVLTSARDMMAPFKGSFAIKKTQRFWESWDGIKKVAFEMQEGRDKSKEEFEDRVSELEEGRYLK